MNDNDLEKQLSALTDALQRPDPTAAWKADILSRALREASVIPFKRNLPPRWLMIGWAAAWAAIVAMNFLTPQDRVFNDWVKQSKTQVPTASQPEELSVVIAFQQRQKLNLQLP